MKTTAKDFEKFRGYCREWIGVFGLLDYNFRFVHKAVGDAKYAHVRAGTETRVAVVTLCQDWGRDVAVTDEQLRRTALHEILHVVLNGLDCAGQERFVSRVEFDSAEEAVVVRLENAIYALAGRRK